MLESLAKFFRGFNIAMGASTIPADATQEVKRKFVYSWLGICAVFVAWIVLLLIWIVS